MTLMRITLFVLPRFFFSSITRYIDTLQQSHIIRTHYLVAELNIVTEFGIFYLLTRGFRRTFATGVAYPQRTLSPPNNRFCPVRVLHMFHDWDHTVFLKCHGFRNLNFEHPSVPLFYFQLDSRTWKESWRGHYNLMYKKIWLPNWRIYFTVNLHLQWTSWGKGIYLTESYDISPYTNRKFKKVKWQHKNATKTSSIQRLRTDLERSVRVTDTHSTVVVLNRFMGSRPSH